MKLGILVLSLAAALCACAQPRAIYYGQEFSALYRPLEISAAGTQGPVPLLVRGSPFGADAGRTAERLRAGMQRSASLHPIRLTLEDPGPRAVDYRVIVAFGLPALGANGLCAAPDAPFTPTDGLAATAAFCIGDRLVSMTRGRSLDAVRGSEDPAFAEFAKMMTDALFPPSATLRRACGPFAPC